MKLLKGSSKRLIVALVAVTALAVPSAASANTANIYLNGVVAANTWWGGTTAFTHMVDHAVWYPGSGTVGVCEKLWNQVYISNRCAANVVYAGSDLNGHYNETYWVYAKNNSAYAHTIVGDAITN